MTLIAKNVEDSFDLYLVPDNVLEESFGHTAQVTNHPIGRKATPADHRIDDPFTVTLVLRVTESPLSEGEQGSNPLLFNTKSGELRANENTETFVIAAEIGNRPRCIAFREALERYKAGEWEYMSKGMGLYTPCVMTSLTYTVTSAMHIDFNISLQEIEYIEAQRVELPVLKVLKKAPETCPTVPTGDKAKTSISATDPTSARDRSLLQNGVGGLAGSSSHADILNAINKISGP